jgi:hypothetical protein
MSKAKTFILYALSGLYANENGKDVKKIFFEISKPKLLNVLGMSRLGSSQREELQDTCIREGIAMAELVDKFIFFDPEMTKESGVFNMDAKASQLKKWTDKYDKLKRGEADKEWYGEFESDGA